jgi:hypothetical protein
MGRPMPPDPNENARPRLAGRGALNIDRLSVDAVDAGPDAYIAAFAAGRKGSRYRPRAGVRDGRR